MLDKRGVSNAESSHGHSEAGRASGATTQYNGCSMTSLPWVLATTVAGGVISWIAYLIFAKSVVKQTGDSASLIHVAAAARGFKAGWWSGLADVVRGLGVIFKRRDPPR
jgi:hypothetical protein